MCEYCEPYNEKFIKGENGYACVTKNGELIVFSNTDFEVCAVHLKINYCPICGRKLTEAK